MQINLFNIKKIVPYLGWVLLFLVLWFKGCSPGPQVVTIPAITKTLPADTIIQHQVADVSKMLKDRTNEKKLSNDILEMYDRIEDYQNEIESLKDYYTFADSIQKDSIFKLLTEIKKFSSEFEDENLILTINGIVAKNEVKEVTPTYTIKEQKVSVKTNDMRIRLIGGFGVGNSINFDKPIFQTNLGFQNAKGNVLNFSFDTEKKIIIGYSWSLIKL